MCFGRRMFLHLGLLLAAFLCNDVSAKSLVSSYFLFAQSAPPADSLKELMVEAHSKHVQGNYAESERLLKQVIASLENTPGSDQLLLSSALNNLAESYREDGKYANAEQLYLRSIELDEKYRPPGDATVSSSLNNLGLLYKQEGRYGEAEPLHIRALSLTTKAYGKDDVRVAITLNCLGSLYMAQGRYADAEPLAVRSLQIRQKLLPPDHPDIGTALNNLALIYFLEHKVSDARSMEEQAVRIDRNAWGNDASVVAVDLINLGDMNKSLGDDRAAESDYLEALRIQQKALGPDHPEVEHASMTLAGFYASKDDYRKAEPYFQQAFASLTRQFHYHFTYMSEQDRLGFLQTVSSVFPAYLNFCFKYRDQDPSLRGAMYDIVLLQKGLVVESMVSFRERLATRGDKQSLQLLDELAARRANIAKIERGPSSASPRSRAEVDRLEREANQLERELAKQSAVAGERGTLASATWRDVQKALSPGQAAVEYLQLPLHRPDGGTTSQFVALVVTAGREAWPSVVSLGETPELEYAVLHDYWDHVDNKVSPSATGLPLYNAFWKPIAAQLAGAKQVYVSPDGLLNEISFAALPADDGKLLIEDYDVRTVLSTKDLLRKSQLTANRSAVLVGDPFFDLSAADAAKVLAARTGKQAAGDRSKRSTSPASGQSNPRVSTRSPEPGRLLERLPGTAVEVKAIADLLREKGWRVESFVGQDALEENVKTVNHPRLLHIATHGFFDPDQKPVGDRFQDPMLGSGLYFAGANRALSELQASNNLESGILTAYEATTLDLQGTELVVLSACETGLGHTSNGEGVFGLRRAFQEAGAQTLMMSMWKVPDAETELLMQLFYQKWLAGKDKHEALREAQLEVRKGVISHWHQDRPHDWAAFVLVGP